MGANIDLNTSHCRHIFIFFCQLPWTLPWHIVPLINQQRCPPSNSHAGHFCLISGGHFRITQQGPFPLLWDLFKVRRNSNWRSVCTGMFLHPCSKLCTALIEIPNNCANWSWVFSKPDRIWEDSLLSIQIPLPWRPSSRHLSLFGRIPQSGISVNRDSI